MRNVFMKAVFGVALVALLTLASCAKQRGDGPDYSKQIAQLEQKVNDITAKLNAGKLIKDVKVDGNKLTIELTDGTKTEFEPAGGSTAPATKIEINEEGFWVINGKVTDKKAQGPKGEAGQAGKHGKYYIPKDDGYWYVVTFNEKGEAQEPTKVEPEQKWLLPGVLTGVYKDGVLTLHNVKDAKDGKVVLACNSLNNLIVIPDIVPYQGLALPMVDFSPLRTDCGDVSVPNTVRFRVSPSNATLDLIDVENLAFEHNTPKLRANALKAKVLTADVKLENGILSVPFTIDATKLQPAGSTKVDQLQLKVPLKAGGDIYSDWFVPFEDVYEYTDLRIAEGTRNDGEVDDTKVLVQTLADAKTLVAKGASRHATIIDMKYDETLDLKDKFETLLVQGPGLTEFDMQKYGLSFAFDLKDENGETIEYNVGSNNTDQQKFITLAGSQITTRVYEIDGASPTAVDRTPIVRVVLKSDQVDCNVTLGFIKINIVKEIVAPVAVTHVFEAVEAGCDAIVHRLGTPEMNMLVYHAYRLPKDVFHNTFDFDGGTGVGTIDHVQNIADTESYNITWTFTPAEQAANAGQTLERVVTYTERNNGGRKITITLKAQITAPEVNVANLLIANFWKTKDNKTYVEYNVAMPAEGSIDPAQCTFATNINSVFQPNGKLLALDASKYAYEYVFAPIEDQVAYAEGFTFSVSADGKTLSAKKGVAGTEEAVAVIAAQNATDGDLITYQETATAKELLNMGSDFMKATLQLKVKSACNAALTINVKGLPSGDKFDVRFLRPINLAGTAEDRFYDGQNAGSLHNLLDIKNIVGLTDWRFTYTSPIPAYTFKANPNYFQYYGVTAVVPIVDQITTKGLIVNGQSLTKLPNTIKVGVATDVADLTTKLPGLNPTGEYQTKLNALFQGATYGILFYHNSGTVLQQGFQMIVPIKVTYKWGDIVTEKVAINVRPTSEAPAN